MDEHCYATAAKGLHTMYLSGIIVVVSVVALIILPLLGGLGAVAGGVAMLVGIHQAGPAHEGYKTAMKLAIGQLVLGVLGMGGGIFGTVVEELCSVVNCVTIYLICVTTGELLAEREKNELVQRADLIWKLVAGCTVVEVVCTLAAYIPDLAGFTAALLVPTAVVDLIAAFLQMFFCENASKALLS